jgi:hypothetical protein
MTQEDIIRMAKEATNKNVLFEFSPQDIRLFERFAELVAAALAQPEREWQGLTDEEIKDMLDCGRPDLVNIKKAEAKLKEKNK